MCLGEGYSRINVYDDRHEIIEDFKLASVWKYCEESQLDTQT